jgi:hypothetical protein
MMILYCQVLHDSVSHALQPPKPTITACDTDNTATSVKKNDNDNKENCATDEDSACTLLLITSIFPSNISFHS